MCVADDGLVQVMLVLGLVADRPYDSSHGPIQPSEEFNGGIRDRPRWAMRRGRRTTRRPVSRDYKGDEGLQLEPEPGDGAVAEPSSADGKAEILGWSLVHPNLRLWLSDRDGGC